MIINRSEPNDIVDRWIRGSDVRGSFVDIGGIGENSCNERVTFAANCGFQKVCIADLEGPDHHLWTHFERNINPEISLKIDRKYRLNVDHEDGMREFGEWDMVHSTGIMYHVPNPMHTLKNYRMITRKELIINTVIIPDRVTNSKGTLTFRPSTCLFMPALAGDDREILREHYQLKFGWDINKVSPQINDVDNAMPYLQSSGDYSYYPYWWLFTKQSFEAALELLQMKVVDTWTWENHAHFVWLRRRE